jgi:four helix bundle protein
MLRHIMNNFFGYKKLIAWQRADELAHSVYDLTFSFPKDEMFGLISQLKRAVLSIVLNIVEGHARSSKKEFHHFLSISLGSLAETEYLLEFSRKRKYVTAEKYEEVSVLRNSAGQLVWKLFISQK